MPEATIKFTDGDDGGIEIKFDTGLLLLDGPTTAQQVAEAIFKRVVSEIQNNGNKTSFENDPSRN